jgi:hypothetical protein
VSASTTPSLRRPFASLHSVGRVYAFVDLEHPAVAWAVMRGMLVSASHASTFPGFISFMQAGMILAGNNSRIYNESIIELWRARYFPAAVSRMQGIYFLETKAEAKSRIGDNDWPPYFIAENLLEFELLTDKPVTKVDANWITFAKTDSSTGQISLSDLDWISEYWKGTPQKDGPVWEILANGVALVLDEAVRRRCEKYLEELFPQSHVPILMARLASESGTRGGQIHPFLLRQDAEMVSLQYLSSDAEFHDQEVIEAIKEHPDSGRLGGLMSQHETWKIPDLRPWGRTYKLGLRLVPQLGELNIPSIHDNFPRQPVGRISEA